MRLHGDDPAVLRPDLLERREQQFAPLRKNSAGSRLGQNPERWDHHRIAYVTNGFSGDEMVREALDVLAPILVLTEEIYAESHVVVRLTGCTSDEATSAIGTYLTAALAGVVQVDIRLASQFLGVESDREAALRQRVERVVGADNEFQDEHRARWRDTRRNPWIAEGIGHLILFMAGEEETGCLAGRVAALKALHAQATQQGLDLVAIYAAEDLPALAVGEVKATRSDPSGQLTDAATFFKKLEEGERDGDLVADVTMLAPALTDVLRAALPETFWDGRRTYLPLIVCGVVFDPHAERQLLRELSPAREHKRVMVLAIPTFYAFFDRIADAMRASVTRFTD